MSLNWFGSILVHHPFIILMGVAVFSGTCLIIPFTLKALPNFADPQLGFETRGTSISKRTSTWTNLVEATKERGLFTGNPKQFLERTNITNFYKLRRKLSGRKNIQNNDDLGPKIVFEPSNVTDPSAQDWRDLRQLSNMNGNPRKWRKTFKIAPQKFFCGPPQREYAHLVLSSATGLDLFNLETLLVLCRIEQELIQTKHYTDLCSSKSEENHCCRPWSLANYIALLQDRTSCLAITEEDVNATRSLLQSCSKYFHNLEINADCNDKTLCRAPRKCIEHDAVYNIMHYLVSITFLPPNDTKSVILNETMIFIPLACSTAILPYYHELEKYQVDYGGIKVVAMEFGIKSALFDEYLFRDTWLIGIGGVFVLMCMWLYTRSLFLTIMTIIAIVFSLGISYFMYTLVFELHFFPFMNLLATVVAVGIGADDAFIFCKVWHTVKANKSNCLVQIMNDTMHHALLSMIVTSFTTAAAFFASYVSAITAVKCFSVFASISVLANCFLMIFWFPACVIIMEKFLSARFRAIRGCLLACMQRWCCGSVWTISMICYTKYCNFERMLIEKEKMFIDFVVRFRFLWFTSLTLLAIASSFIVLYYPKLELPNTPDFQLFDTSHLFEQYDLKYKYRFWFTKGERLTLEGTALSKMPLRFVWGIVPQDNGNYMEPKQFGTLEVDDAFNMSSPESQQWLLEFCKSLKKQPFYQPQMGVLFPNCFIEAFVDWMERRCKDEFEDIDRSPCCETSIFPFKSWIFNACIMEALSDLYATVFYIPGLAGPKFSKDQVPTIKAVVVEYASNYTYSLSYNSMSDFINQVELWFGKEMETAPKTMKGGWFTSTLEFYDVQKILSEGTIIAIGVSMGLALIVLFLVTLNLLTSLYAIFTITCSIFVTMAILVLLGWKLNILESIAVSTAIGLTVDFSLHYTVNYRLAPPETAIDRQAAARFSLMNMLKPVTMAALTTCMAGAFMLPSTILAYIQIGTFLVTVMCVSWVYSTFHLIALLAICGPQNNFGQCSYSQLLCRSFRCDQSNKLVRKRQGTSSISDTHELDLLTNSKSYSNSSAPNLLHRTLSGGKQNSSRYTVSDQSPSATSAITIIMTEDT